MTSTRRSKRRARRSESRRGKRVFRRLLENKPLIALIGAVVIPFAALFYLAGLPARGRGSLVAILLQVLIVVASVVLFAVFLAKVVEQVNARRVRNWLKSAEGQDWLNALPDVERIEFLDRLDGNTSYGTFEAEEESPVDTPEEGR